MVALYLSDLFERAQINPKKVKLIRHALSDKEFCMCFENGLVKEYTQLQKKDFSKDYDYWMVFISDTGTAARFEGLYKVNGVEGNTRDKAPDQYPIPERFDGQGSYYTTEKLDVFRELENRLIINWGTGTRSWHQKGTKDKEIIAIQEKQSKQFSGFENLLLSYQELKDIVGNRLVYENWHTALSSVNAIYLITDTMNGKQYVGSAYGKRGLLGRWSVYADTGHGNNKKILEEVCEYPERYQYFQFSILQLLRKNILDEEVIKIENLWKSKLLSKQFGMNDN